MHTLHLSTHQVGKGGAEVLAVVSAGLHRFGELPAQGLRATLNNRGLPLLDLRFSMLYQSSILLTELFIVAVRLLLKLVAARLKLRVETGQPRVELLKVIFHMAHPLEFRLYGGYAAAMPVKDRVDALQQKLKSVLAEHHLNKSSEVEALLVLVITHGFLLY